MYKQQYLPEGLMRETSPDSERFSLSALECARDTGKILEAPAVRCSSTLDLLVDLGNVRGIIPKSEVAYVRDGAPKDIAAISRVGKNVSFKVTDIYKDASGRLTAMLSRREAQKECLCEHLLNLRSGDILTSRVTHLEPFGAFVDIGCGVVSLLPIDCISVSRISHPRDRFSIGDRIRVAVKSVDRANERISVTHKELLGSWEENAALYSIGQTVTGIVRSIEDYGIFVELSPNLAGLAETREDVRVGERAAVYIKNIIPERMKVKLVIIDCGEDTMRSPIEYFIPEDADHIGYWRYSPDECRKVIETEFE